MDRLLYVGLDIHKKVIAFCEKEADGTIVSEGTLAATRQALGEWAAGLRRPWEGAMEATLFTGWIYDFLLPHATALKVAHPKMLKAIVASKKKSDRVDARKIADALPGQDAGSDLIIHLSLPTPDPAPDLMMND